jgi:hypothetical protein
MVDVNMPLTEAEAQQLAKNFLLGEHYESKIDFTNCQLIDKDNTQIYLLQGKITMRSRSPMSRFVAPKSANQYQFKIEIDAQQRNIVSYEIV